jgi:hypothetical protein
MVEKITEGDMSIEDISEKAAVFRKKHPVN